MVCQYSAKPSELTLLYRNHVNNRVLQLQVNFLSQIGKYLMAKTPQLEKKKLRFLYGVATVEYPSCCCLPDPFRGMGAWRKTMEPQKPGNSPGSGPEVVKRQRVAKERVAQRVRSWTVQNEMRDVLGRVSTGAAGSILDSTNPKEIRT